MSAATRVLVRVVLIAALLITLAPGLGVAGPRRAERPDGLVTDDGLGPTGDILVQFKAGASASERAAAHASAKSRVVREFGILPGLVLVHPDRNMPLDAALRVYRNRPNVDHAVLDEAFQAAAGVPDDPMFGLQWGLQNLGGPDARLDADISAVDVWEDTTGSPEVVVGVIDSGVNWNHEDLYGNLWTNPGEVAGDGLDNDSNGHVDDVHGWDFTTNDNDPSDQMSISHGTHVAGIIGAEGNNAKGIAGVDHDVSILPLRVLNANGVAVISNVVLAIQYADSVGADIVNMSLAWSGNYADINNAIAAYEGLAVCAAGNDSRSNDVTPMYPASHPQPNILAVGATTDDDVRASYSNWGAANVDVFAPGDEIISTVSLWDTLWYDDMNDLDGWSTARYVTKPWSVATMGYVSPPASAGHMGYANSESSYLILNTPVDLTGAAYARLSFDLWLHTEANWDWVRVYASEDPVITDADYLTRFSGGGAVWYNDLQADLSKFVGKQVYLAFELRTDSSYTLSGAMVDDVTVLGGDNGSAYSLLSGTSMAAPHAAGVAALLLAEKPELTAAELKALIMNGATPLPELAGLCVTGARVDAMASRDLVGDLDPPVTTASGVPAGWGAAPVGITLIATDDRSGIAWTRYSLDGAAELDGTTVEVSEPGTHTLTYRSADASGHVEALHEVTFVVANRYEEAAPGLVWSRPWLSLARTMFSGGTSKYISATGASVSVPFSGTGIAWIGSRSTSAGKARVYLDDVLVATVDTYRSPNLHQQVLWSRSGMADGPHTLRVEATGMRNPRSIGYNIWADAFDVIGVLSGP